MKKNLVFILSLAMLAFTACNSDDDNGSSSFSTSVAFGVPSLNLTEATTPVQIVFSKPTTAAGSLNISLVTTPITYGTDFTTAPA
ncbi:MAG: hypothetical protein DI548_10400, partial [Flavobacterium johnsoniae]